MGTIRQFSRIIMAILAMNGRVTMLGIFSWASSYRTVMRFFKSVVPWTSVFWIFFRRYLLSPNDTHLLAGDEVVISKAGKKTHGLDKFFSSLMNQPISGLSFFTLSLVSVEKRHSFPIQSQMTVTNAANLFLWSTYPTIF